jgi:hypothetical protein
MINHMLYGADVAEEFLYAVGSARFAEKMVPFISRNGSYYGSR